jgi:hypothetical protein
LFVSGLQNPAEILVLSKQNNAKHIHFGTDQSFNPRSIDELKQWNLMIISLLKQNYWCTLEFDNKFIEDIQECEMITFRKFIAKISVKLPNLQKLNYNSILKIDDKEFEFSNPGIWTHRLHDLQDYGKFVDWDQYKGDTTS